MIKLSILHQLVQRLLRIVIVGIDEKRMGQLLTYLVYGSSYEYIKKVENITQKTKCKLLAYYKTQSGICIEYMYLERTYFVNFWFPMTRTLTVDQNFQIQGLVRIPLDNQSILFLFS